MTTTVSIEEVLTVSEHTILDGQDVSGAFIASPDFAQYHFGWLRDGAYCAMAMTALGQRESVDRFHAWVARTLEAQRPRVEQILARLAQGAQPARSLMLPARYSLSGDPETETDAWPNFQLDGYGTWLYSVYDSYGSSPPEGLVPAIELAAEYLTATWRMSCFDYWEEYGHRQHTSTLAAIAAGLRAAGRLLPRATADRVADDVLDFILDRCVSRGAFVKGPEDDRVDASLISVATPFGLVDGTDAIMDRTIERIRTELSSPSGGIRRYRGDTYYGGNPWLLLTAWLGWHDRLLGRTERHEQARTWIMARAEASGQLAEQTLDEPAYPEYVDVWLDRWGPVATPLLWSHAKFVLMESDSVAASWS